MKIWWDLKDNPAFAKDMEMFGTMIDDADDKEICEKNKKCKAKKAKNKGKVTANNVIVDGRRVDGDDLAKFMKIN